MAAPLSAKVALIVHQYLPIVMRVDYLKKCGSLHLGERADIFQPWGNLVRKAPEIPIQHTGLPLIPVKAGIDGLIPVSIEAGMKAGILILNMEIGRRLRWIAFLVVVNRLLLKNSVNVSF